MIVSFFVVYESTDFNGKISLLTDFVIAHKYTNVHTGTQKNHDFIVWFIVCMGDWQIWKTQELTS